DLAAGQGERVGLLVDEQRAFPARLPARGQLAGDGTDHAPHVGGLAGVGALRQLRLVLGERLRAHLVELLLGHRADLLGTAGGGGGGGAGGGDRRDRQAEQQRFDGRGFHGRDSCSGTVLVSRPR